MSGQRRSRLSPWTWPTTVPESSPIRRARPQTPARVASRARRRRQIADGRQLRRRRQRRRARCRRPAPAAPRQPAPSCAPGWRCEAVTNEASSRLGAEGLFLAGAAWIGCGCRERCRRGKGRRTRGLHGLPQPAARRYRPACRPPLQCILQRCATLLVHNKASKHSLQMLAVSRARYVATGRIM